MTKYSSYYDLLDIEPNATTEEIQSAYFKKATEYHPDRNDDPRATEWFQYIVQAKEVLSHPEKRLEYDYIIGVRQRPASVLYFPDIQRSNNFKTEDIVKAGAIGIIVGLFLGGLE